MSFLLVGWFRNYFVLRYRTLDKLSVFNFRGVDGGSWFSSCMLFCYKSGSTYRFVFFN